MVRVGSMFPAVIGQNAGRDPRFSAVAGAPRPTNRATGRGSGAIMASASPSVSRTPRNDGPTSVYRYYDSFDILIYVGITSRGINRNHEHNEKSWWPHVVRQDVEHFPTRAAALAQEKRLIQQWCPPFNKQHNPSHAELRDAYHQLRSAAPDVDPRVLADELCRGLPMTVTAGPDAGSTYLRTHPAHFALARLIQWTPNVRVNGSKAMPLVTGMTLVGPFAVFELNNQLPRTVLAAQVVIKWNKAPHSQPTMHSVQIKMDRVGAPIWTGKPQPSKTALHHPGPDQYLPCLASNCDSRQVYDRLCAEHLGVSA